jgi:membrane-associated PAP2 superfamily phosphatase
MTLLWVSVAVLAIAAGVIIGLAATLGAHFLTYASVYAFYILALTVMAVWVVSMHRYVEGIKHQDAEDFRDLFRGPAANSNRTGHSHGKN